MYTENPQVCLGPNWCRHSSSQSCYGSSWGCYGPIGAVTELRDSQCTVFRIFIFRPPRPFLEKNKPIRAVCQVVSFQIQIQNYFISLSRCTSTFMTFEISHDQRIYTILTKKISGTRKIFMHVIKLPLSDKFVDCFYKFIITLYLLNF